MSRPLRAVLGVLLVVAGIVLGLYVRSRVPAGDHAVLNFMLARRTPAWTAFFRGVSLCGGTPAVTVMTVLVAAVAAVRRWWVLAAQVVLAGVGVAVLVVGAKAAFGRPRPPAATQLGVLQSLSFPSGHALGSMVAAGMVVTLVVAGVRSRPARVCAVALAVVYVLLVGVSRLYLGVHWGSDVLGGWAIGGGWALLCLGVAGPTVMGPPIESAPERHRDHYD